MIRRVVALVLSLTAAAASVRASGPDPYGAGPDTPAHGVPDAERAWRNYALNCQGCHRPDGTGGADTAPALAGHLGIFTHIDGGRTYLGRVPGVATAPLPDDQLAELLNWVLWRFDPGHMSPEFLPYTAGEIATLRRAPLRTEADATRAALLAKAAP